MSVIICECGRHVDTDFEDEEDGKCMSCFEADLDAALAGQIEMTPAMIEALQ